MYFLTKDGVGYDTEFNPQIEPPEGAVEVTREKLFEIQNGRNAGKVLSWDGDVPTLQDPPPPGDDQLMNALRIKRNDQLRSSDDVVRRQMEQKELGIETALSAEDYKRVLAWRQALRDLPETTKIESASDLDGAVPACPVEL